MNPMRDVGFNAGAVQKPQIGLAPASSDDFFGQRNDDARENQKRLVSLAGT